MEGLARGRHPSLDHWCPGIVPGKVSNERCALWRSSTENPDALETGGWLGLVWVARCDEKWQGIVPFARRWLWWGCTLAAAPGRATGGRTMKRGKHPAGPGGGGFQELLAVVRRRRWTLLVVPALMTGTAAGLSLVQPRVYQSRVEVLVRPIPLTAAASQTAVPVNMRTEASVVSSRDVASAAAARLGIQPNPDELLGGLTVTPDEGSAQVLTVAYASSNPREAQYRAQAFADGYLDVRRKLALDELATSARAVQSQIVALQSRLEGVDA